MWIYIQTSQEGFTWTGAKLVIAEADRTSWPCCLFRGALWAVVNEWDWTTVLCFSGVMADVEVNALGISCPMDDTDFRTSCRCLSLIRFIKYLFTNGTEYLCLDACSSSESLSSSLCNNCRLVEEIRGLRDTILGSVAVGGDMGGDTGISYGTIGEEEVAAREGTVVDWSKLRSGVNCFLLIGERLASRFCLEKEELSSSFMISSIKLVSDGFGIAGEEWSNWWRRKGAWLDSIGCGGEGFGPCFREDFLKPSKPMFNRKKKKKKIKRERNYEEGEIFKLIYAPSTIFRVNAHFIMIPSLTLSP